MSEEVIYYCSVIDKKFCECGHDEYDDALCDGCHWKRPKVAEDNGD